MCIKMLRFVINCVKNDPQNGDYWDDQCHTLLKDAGTLLFQFDGMDGMHDRLAWSFIPPRYHRHIECAWRGIGSWKA